MKTFFKITIITKPFNPELISGLLWQFEPEGIEENESSIIFYKQIINKEIKDLIINLFEELKNSNEIESFTLKEELLEDKNWNEDWEKTILPIEVSNKIVIKPTFRDYQPKPGQLIITIDPKMSFGTGEHQTTKLVLQILEETELSNKKILDAGTGTGVLAIASVLLGAKNAIAFDNDEWCFENGIENCQLNNVSDKVEIRCCELENITETNFDIVIANIHKSVLLEISGKLCNKVSKNGKLILSGLLKEDEDEIINHYKIFGMNFLLKKTMDEWIALVFENNI